MGTTVVAGLCLGQTLLPPTTTPPPPQLVTKSRGQFVLVPMQAATHQSSSRLLEIEAESELFWRKAEVGPRAWQPPRREMRGSAADRRATDGKVEEAKAPVLEVRKLGEIGVCENIWRAVWRRHSCLDAPPAPSSGTEGKAPGPERFRLEQPQVQGLHPAAATLSTHLLIAAVPGLRLPHPCPLPQAVASNDQHTFCSEALDTSCTVPPGCG